MIRVEDIWKSYGTNQVLKGLSLNVFKGTTMVILGRSGVGKSVLLRQLIGIDTPDKGSIWINGSCITALKEKEKLKVLKDVGMLFQSSALFDSMTVGENVAFYMRQHREIHGEVYGDANGTKKLSEKEIKERVLNALHQVGLDGYEDKMPAELSGGQKRRAALARLIIYRPKILLFDEPTTGLDPITASTINKLISSTVKSLDATAIVVTHDLNSALEVGDYFALHHEGKIAYVDEKQAFLQRGDTLVRTYLEHAIVPPHFQSLIQTFSDHSQKCQHGPSPGAVDHDDEKLVQENYTNMLNDLKEMKP